MDKSHINLAILIVNFKSLQKVEILVSQIVNVLSPYDGWSIRIADNSGEILMNPPNWGNSVSIIDTGGNVGFGRACNILARESFEKYLFFVNPDIQISDSSFLHFFEVHELLKESLGNKYPLVLGGQLFDEKGNDQPSYGNFPSIYELLRTLLAIRTAINIVNFSLAGFRLNAVDYVTGAFMFLSRKDFEHVGGFDERFFLYYEETELQFRVKKLGGYVFSLNEVRAIHENGGTHSSSISREFYILYGLKIYISIVFRGWRFFFMSLLWGANFLKLQLKRYLMS